MSSGMATHEVADEGFAGKFLSWAGAYLISFVGLIHLLESEEHFGYAPYLGVLFLINFLLAAIAAAGLVRSGRRWAWLLGDFIAGGALLGFVVSRTVGLPGFPEGVGQWFNLPAWITLAIAVSYLPLSLLALTRRGGAVMRSEREKIERERVPPDTKETPEHFALIEEDMRDIRTRMERDIVDLRSHARPRTVSERTRECLAKDARGIRPDRR